jgi:hypothetical protein
LYVAEIGILRKIYHKYLEGFEIWCWRRIEVSWDDFERKKEVLHIAKEERNILRIIK